MARQRFAPRHSLDGPHVFIASDDSAWDSERIERECAEIREAAGWIAPNDPLEAMRTDPSRRGPDAHVFWRYWDGLTRFDLSAEGIGDYLDMNKHPEAWVLRPLGLRDVHVARGLDEQGNHKASAAASFLRGCVGLQAPRGEHEVALDALLRARADGKGPSRPSEEKVWEAVERIAYEIPEVVGSAVNRLSRDLTEEEKKPSAGPLGASSGNSPVAASSAS